MRPACFMSARLGACEARCRRFLFVLEGPPEKADSSKKGMLAKAF
jgi:hypothetical protein